MVVVKTDFSVKLWPRPSWTKHIKLQIARESGKIMDMEVSFPQSKIYFWPCLELSWRPFFILQAVSMVLQALKELNKCPPLPPGWNCQTPGENWKLGLKSKNFQRWTLSTWVLFLAWLKLNPRTLFFSWPKFFIGTKNKFQTKHFSGAQIFAD